LEGEELVGSASSTATGITPKAAASKVGVATNPPRRQ
jgi:hypothetical protein